MGLKYVVLSMYKSLQASPTVKKTIYLLTKTYRFFIFQPLLKDSVLFNIQSYETVKPYKKTNPAEDRERLNSCWMKMPAL